MYKTVAIANSKVQDRIQQNSNKIGSILNSYLQVLSSYYENEVTNGAQKQKHIGIRDGLHEMTKKLLQLNNLTFQEYLQEVDKFDDKQETSLLSIRRGLNPNILKIIVRNNGVIADTVLNKWISICCLNKEIVNLQGDRYVLVALRNDLDEQGLQTAEELVPGAYDRVFDKYGTSEDYLYVRDNISGEERKRIETDLVNSLVLFEPSSADFTEAPFYSWNHSHPTDIPDGVEVMEKFKSNAHFFSEKDLGIINSVRSFAEVFSTLGIAFADRLVSYIGLDGNENLLQISSGYKKYVNKLLVFRDAYDYISRKSKINESNKVRVALLLTSNWINMNPRDEIVASLKQLGLEQSLLDKFKNGVCEGPAQWRTFFGIKNYYPEIDALSKGHISYFVSRSRLNRMMERTELGNMKYQEAIEFIKLRSSKVLRLMLCEKYDLSDLFIRDRRFSGHKIVSASAKKECIPLFNELWSSKNLTEARTARDKILKAFDDLYKSGKLYED